MYNDWDMTYVKFSKVEPAANPHYPTPTNEEYKVGKFNIGSSVPTGYCVTGTLFRGPVVGISLLIERDSRNGEKYDGTMRTSMVQKIEKISDTLLRIETMNSVYFLEKIEVN